MIWKPDRAGRYLSGCGRGGMWWSRARRPSTWERATAIQRDAVAAGTAEAATAPAQRGPLPWRR
ncbi:hypothetical protein DSL92_02910 [Billgrantia gudaonensis]|uniref:Uncharacterized protein n=1 Tax=Billgrantia gudaonensis TaxID=376427 RepID=A0A3S0NED3_9GAMM|nr:hypothetical protein DSL92_02910 [Halomonas gudaonensis]